MAYELEGDPRSATMKSTKNAAFETRKYGKDILSVLDNMEYDIVQEMKLH